MAGNRQKEFEICWHDVERKITSFFYRKGCSSDDSCDLAQETALRGWKNFDTLRGDFKPWIFQIAKYVFIDYLRKRRGVTTVDIDDCQIAGNSHESYAQTELKSIMDEILEELDPFDRKCLILHDLEGKNFEEIAIELGNSVSNAHYHVDKARKFLRQRFEESGAVVQ